MDESTSLSRLGCSRDAKHDLHVYVYDATLMPVVCSGAARTGGAYGARPLILVDRDAIEAIVRRDTYGSLAVELGVGWDREGHFDTSEARADGVARWLRLHNQITQLKGTTHERPH